MSTPTAQGRAASSQSAAQTLSSAPTAQATRELQLKQFLRRDNGYRYDWLCSAALIMFVCAVFAKTVVLGQPISKLYRLAHWDALFADVAAGTSALMDPSLVQLIIPHYYLVANLFHAGQVPLWNSYSGFGVPLIADLQANVFAPMRLLFDIFPGQRAYNLYLVGLVCLSTVSGYWLGRTLSLSRFAACFAALAYGLCPLNLWYIELSSGQSAMFAPVTFLFMARAAIGTRSLDCLLAGASCAALIASGHPESSFWIIGAATLLMLALVLQRAESTKQAIAHAWKCLSRTSVSALLFAGPVFFPFVEYLLHTDCYKFGTDAAPAFVPWQGLLQNLFNPTAGGASPYLGLSALGLCLCSIWSRHKSLALICWTLCVLSFWTTSLLFPLNILLAKPPLNALIVQYAAPVFLLFVALIAGLGLDAILQDAVKSRRWWMLPFIGVLLVCPLLLSTVNLSGGKFDVALPAPKFSWRDFGTALASASLLLAALGLRNRLPFAFQKPVVASACVLANCIALLVVVKQSLPVQPSFEYPQTPIVKELKKLDGRMVATSDQLLKPNTNIVFGISDIRAHNPLFPERFISFATAAGARTDQFNQYYDGKLNKLLDAASLKYVLSTSPVIAEDDKLPEPESLKSTMSSELPVKFANGLVVKDVEMWVRNHDVGGTIKLEGAAPPRSCVLLLSLMDGAGNVLGRTNLLEVRELAGALRTNISFLTALRSSLADSHIRVCVQQFDRDRVAFVSSVSGKDLVVAGAASHTSSDVASQFVLKKEFANGIRLYRNTACAPQAFLADTVERGASASEVLSRMKSAPFQVGKTALVEADDASWQDIERFFQKEETVYDGKERSVCLVERPTTNAVEITVESQKPRLLVLNDTFYPGWHAYVDGARTAIYRVNYLFRGVLVPAGEHRVLFQYEPLSFYGGVLGFVFVSSITLALLYRRFAR